MDDGVVVGESSLALTGSLGVTIVASAAGLKTDLSGLDLVKNELFLRRREMVSLSVVKALASAVLEAAPEDPGKSWPPVGHELRGLPPRLEEALGLL